MEIKIQLNDFDHIVVEDIYNGGIYFRMFSKSQMGKERVFNDGVTQKMGISDNRLDQVINDLIELRNLRNIHRERLNSSSVDIEIVFTNYKAIENNYTDQEVKEEVLKMCKHIENNFDKKIIKAELIGADVKLFHNYELDDSQIERLQDNFNIISGFEHSTSEFTLLNLDV